MQLECETEALSMRMSLKNDRRLRAFGRGSNRRSVAMKKYEIKENSSNYSLVNENACAGKEMFRHSDFSTFWRLLRSESIVLKK